MNVICLLHKNQDKICIHPKNNKVQLNRALWKKNSFSIIYRFSYMHAGFNDSINLLCFSNHLVTWTTVGISRYKS